MNFKKILLYGLLPTCILAFTISAVVTKFDTKDNVELVEAEAKVADTRNEELNKKIKASWERANTQFNIKETNYTKTEWLDINHIANKLEEPTKTNYLDTLRESINKVRQKGDYIPVVYTNADLSENIILFERENRKIVKLVINEELPNQKQERHWILTSKEEK